MMWIPQGGTCILLAIVASINSMREIQDGVGKVIGILRLRLLHPPPPPPTLGAGGSYYFRTRVQQKGQRRAPLWAHVPDRKRLIMPLKCHWGVVFYFSWGYGYNTIDAVLIFLGSGLCLYSYSAGVESQFNEDMVTSLLTALSMFA